jgi:hypothetical protein
MMGEGPDGIWGVTAVQGESWRLTDVVMVPDVVGLLLADAVQLAHDAGVVLAQPDPDGPPLAALTWPGDFLVTKQSPQPGVRLWRWDAVVVGWSPVDRGDGAGVREPRRPIPPLNSMAAPLPNEPDPEIVYDSWAANHCSSQRMGKGNVGGTY